MVFEGDVAGVEILKLREVEVNVLNMDCIPVYSF
jgi:hypothetical protein